MTKSGGIRRKVFNLNVRLKYKLRMKPKRNLKEVIHKEIIGYYWKKN